jgi:oligopeptide/dipeptide ABC transporter ATP-binding protein
VISDRTGDQTAAVEDATSRPGVRALGLRKSYVLARNLLGRPIAKQAAVDGVDVDVAASTTLGIVGESGSGKTTLGRLLALLTRPDEGRVELDGTDITRLRRRELKAVRAQLQVIFQDPYGALDPTKTIAHAVAEPLRAHGLLSRRDVADRAASLLEGVALDPSVGPRYPAELSGGQRQRVCIARAVALKPRVLIADEPTSALDLSTRAEILNLLLSLQEQSGQAIVLISHDFPTVQHLAHEIAVMYRGRIVERGPAAQVTSEPLHPYTRVLIAAVPSPDPAAQRVRREASDARTSARPADWAGCAFRNRCSFATEICGQVAPVLATKQDGRLVACHHVQ